MSTKIEWTDETWNPIRGCSRVSEGCRNCYAEKVAYRFSGTGRPYEGLVREVYHQIEQPKKRLPQWNGKIKFVEKHLLDPLKWGSILTGIRNGEGVLHEKAHRDGSVTVTRVRPRRVFVNSMSDLFHENVTDEMLDKIFAVMALCPQHTFQVLTKRPKRMRDYLRRIQDDDKDIQCWTNAAYDSVPHLSPCAAGLMDDLTWPLPNVWLGTSTESQETADDRIQHLLETPAAIRFISAEPLLEEIDMFAFLSTKLRNEALMALGANLPGLNWVIVGGESGPGARPMHPDWARSLRDQCVAAGVPFFFKQWGEWLPRSACYHVNADGKSLSDLDPKAQSWPCVRLTGAGNNGRQIEHSGDGNDVYMQRVGKKAAGHLLDGKEWHQLPEVKHG